MVNCIILNIRGANNAEFKWHCKSMINIHMFAIVALIETRVSDHKEMSEILGYISHI